MRIITPLQYMFYTVYLHIVNYVAPNYLQGVSMQACKTHLVGTQKRKTHIIAGVLTILGCISGVYGASTEGNGGGIPGRGLRVRRVREVVVADGERSASKASEVGGGEAGTAGGNSGGAARAVLPATPTRSDSTKTMGGASKTTADMANCDVVREAVGKVFEAVSKNNNQPTPLVSPRSEVGGGEAGTAGGNVGGAARAGQDGTHYTFALPSGDDITPDDITGDTTVGDLFKKLYEKAKSKNYNWSGPETITITSITEEGNTGESVNELNQGRYDEALKDVFGEHTDLKITREKVTWWDMEIINQELFRLYEDLYHAESIYTSFKRVSEGYKIDEVLRQGNEEAVKKYLEEQREKLRFFEKSHATYTGGTRWGSDSVAVSTEHRPKFDHMLHCLKVDEYLSQHTEWKDDPNLNLKDPKIKLTEFFITPVQAKSQAIYDKLVELTHLKNRPKEWVRDITINTRSDGSLVYSVNDVAPEMAIDYPVSTSHRKPEAPAASSSAAVIPEALDIFKQWYLKNRDALNKGTLEEDTIKENLPSIPHKDAKAAYGRIKYFSWPAQSLKVAIRNIYYELDGDSSYTDKFDKLLVYLYLCKKGLENRETVVNSIKSEIKEEEECRHK